MERPPNFQNESNSLENFIQGIRTICLWVIKGGLILLIPVGIYELNSQQFPNSDTSDGFGILSQNQICLTPYEAIMDINQVCFLVENVLKFEKSDNGTIVFDYSSDYRGTIVKEPLPRIRTSLGHPACFFQVNQWQYVNLNLTIKFDKNSKILYLDDGFECDVPRRNVPLLEERLSACTY